MSHITIMKYIIYIVTQHYGYTAEKTVQESAVRDQCEEFKIHTAVGKKLFLKQFLGGQSFVERLRG